MTKNVDGDSLYSRTLRLIKDYEQARDPDSTEIGRQFAVRLFEFVCKGILHGTVLLRTAFTTIDDRK